MKAKKTIRSRCSDNQTTTTQAALPTMLVEPVEFKYFDFNARKVCLAGTFNNWDAEGIELIPMGDGRWVKELLLPPGSHEYRFVVDGRDIPSAAVTPSGYSQLTTSAFRPAHGGADRTSKHPPERTKNL